MSPIFSPNLAQGRVAGVSTLAPTHRVSDLLSHSRGRQRAEPALEGLATHSGRQSRCFLRTQPSLHIWLASCSPSLFSTAGSGSAPRTRPLPNQARRQTSHQDSCPDAVEPTFLPPLPWCMQLYLQKGSARRKPDGNSKRQLYI